MPGTREPVVLILDPDAVYGADLIDYYFVEHGLRSVLGFTEKNARRIAFADVPQAHTAARSQHGWTCHWTLPPTPGDSMGSTCGLCRRIRSRS